MSQIRVDSTRIKSPQEALLRTLCQQIATEHGGHLGTEATTYYNKVQKSDINLAYFDGVITRGVAINVAGGLGFAGDPYGYAPAYHERTAEIANRYLDTEVEGALRDNQFAVIRQPTGKTGMQFTGTDLSGKQIVIIRDGEQKLRITANGYEGMECEQPIGNIVRALAARGIETETQSVTPKSEEKWLEQTILVNNANN